MSIVKWNIQCVSDLYCREKIITATIQNNSKYPVTAIKVGWILSAKAIECKGVGALKVSGTASIIIAPGRPATISWTTYDGPISRVTGCLRIVGVTTAY